MTASKSGDDPGTFSPTDGLRAEAFKVLVDAVAFLAGELERAPTASEVRLEIGRRTYGGFDLKILGYKRFRDFLSEAAEQGYVQLDQSRPGDMAVHQPGERDLRRDWTQFVRPDLWRAFVDWDSRMLRLYDVQRDKAVLIPREPAPLEPAKFTDLRRQMIEEPENFIEIHPIDMPTQRAWMEEYAQSVGDLEIRALLIKALEGDKPFKLYVDVLRAFPTRLAEWHRELGARVRRVVEGWRDGLSLSKPIDINRKDNGEKPHIEPSTRSVVEDSEPKAANIQRVLRDLVGNLTLSSGLSNTAYMIAGSAAQSELRARLHAAIDRMPVEELRSLRIPVGYLFQD